MNGSDGLGAGLALVLVTVACAAAGGGVGHLLGNAPIGALLGAAIGIVAGFAVVWKLFMEPFRKRSLERDYSHLEPQVEDEDDHR